MIVCVLVSPSRVLAVTESEPCDISIQDTNNLTLNCSRRNIENISDWPEQINDIDKGNDRVKLVNPSLLDITLTMTLYTDYCRS